MQQSLLTHLSRLLNYPSFSLILHPSHLSVTHFPIPPFPPHPFHCPIFFPRLPLSFFSPLSFSPFRPREETPYTPAVCRTHFISLGCLVVPGSARGTSEGSVTRGNVVLFSLFFTFLSCEASRKKKISAYPPRVMFSVSIKQIFLPSFFFFYFLVFSSSFFPFPK